MNFVFKQDNLPEECYWSTFEKFSPLNQEIEYVIYNGAAGIEQIQVEWFSEVEANYLAIEKQLFEFIHQSLNTLESNKKDSYSKKDLTLDSISILKSFSEDACWEMAFSLNNGIEWFTIEIKEWTPSRCYISA